MALRSGGRKPSFDVFNSADDKLLLRSNSDPQRESTKRKRNRKKKKNRDVDNHDVINENTAKVSRVVEDEDNPIELNKYTVVESVVCEETVEPAGYVVGELRQRTAIFGGEESGFLLEEKKREEEEEEMRKIMHESNGVIGVQKLETVESLDWKKLMAQDPNYLFSEQKSPGKYIIDDMFSGNSLRTTTTLANEKERERVYDTIFRLPWRCELLIDVGIFVCFDSFLALLTIMPTRMVMVLWRLLTRSRCLLQWSGVTLVVSL